MRKNTQIEVGTLVLALASESDAERRDAVTRLCVLFEPLATSLAMKYRQSVIGCEREDLEQVARMGLVEACASFNPLKGTQRNEKTGGAFAVHAAWGVRHALAEYLANLPNPVRLRSDLTRLLSKMRRVSVQLAHDFGREPTNEELAEKLNLSEDEIERMQSYELGSLSLNVHHNESWGRGLEVKHRTVIETLPGDVSPEMHALVREEQQALRRQNNE